MPLSGVAMTGLNPVIIAKREISETAVIFGKPVRIGKSVKDVIVAMSLRAEAKLLGVVKLQDSVLSRLQQLALLHSRLKEGLSHRKGPLPLRRVDVRLGGPQSFVGLPLKRSKIFRILQLSVSKLAGKRITGGLA